MYVVRIIICRRPIGDFKSSSDYQYQLLHCNMDLLKIIQYYE
jgi:CCR4-NOT transcription complex subunit 7/8